MKILIINFDFLKNEYPKISLGLASIMANIKRNNIFYDYFIHLI